MISDVLLAAIDAAFCRLGAGAEEGVGVEDAQAAGLVELGLPEDLRPRLAAEERCGVDNGHRDAPDDREAPNEGGHAGDRLDSHRPHRLLDVVEGKRAQQISHPAEQREFASFVHE